MKTNLMQTVVNGQKIEYFLTFKNVKRLTARVRGGQIYVSANPKVSILQIEKFLQDNSSWVIKSLTTPLKKIFYYQGQPYDYSFKVSTDNQIAFGEGVVTVFAQTEDKAQKLIDAFYKQKAEGLVAKAFEEYFPKFLQKYNVKKPTLVFRKYRSKWGSCTASKGEIRFNTLLAKVPKECLEYVVCHELSHLVEMNHGKNFYAVLGSVLPDYKKRKNLLKKVNYIDF